MIYPLIMFEETQSSRVTRTYDGLLEMFDENVEGHAGNTVNSLSVGDDN